MEGQQDRPQNTKQGRQRQTAYLLRVPTDPLNTWMLHSDPKADYRERFQILCVVVSLKEPSQCSR